MTTNYTTQYAKTYIEMLIMVSNTASI